MKRKTLAIPLRAIDFSDSSQVIWLFTREAGLVEGLAKGAHREKNPFQGPFDLCVLYEAVYLEARGAALALLTEAVVLDGFRGLRRRWEAHAAASHVIEFLRAVTVANDPAPELFDLTAETLEALGDSRAGGVLSLVARFDVRALRLLGLLAPLDACVVCGRQWPGGDVRVFLSPRAGGILCRRCRFERPALPGATLSGRAAGILKQLGDDEVPGDAWGELEDSWPEFGRPAARALAALRTHLLERELVCLAGASRIVPAPRR
jgi:DNA repair protein RecO (recombination protein O)